MKSKHRFISLMMTIATVISLSVGLSSCSSVDGGKFAMIGAVFSAENDFERLSNNLDQAKTVYADNRSFFTISDQKEIDGGLVKIENSVKLFKQFKASDTVKKVTSSADFLASYRQARQGYLSIRQVLMRRQDDLTQRNRLAFKQFDEDAKRIDVWAYKLSANEKNSERIKTVTDLITIGAQLIAVTGKG